MATKVKQRARRGAAFSLGGFDIATAGGILIAVGFIANAILVGGAADTFVDWPAVMIVFGGTFGVTSACFSLSDVYGTIKATSQTVFRKKSELAKSSLQLIQLAQVARLRGPLALDGHLHLVSHLPLFQRGLSLLIDSITGDDLERIMTRYLQATAHQQRTASAVLRKAAEISPAMGLIGTLVGLVQMLGNLDDPTTIGPSMSVALLTTFYGAILGNVIFMPLANKLERNSLQDRLLDTLCMMAVMSISRQENPRRLEMLMNTILPERDKVSYFD